MTKLPLLRAVLFCSVLSLALASNHASAQTVGTGSGTTCGSHTTFMQCGILPQGATTYSAPLTVAVTASSPNPITGWAVYVNGTQWTPDAGSIITTGSTTGYFDVTLSSLSTGTYTIGVNTWDSSGAVKVYQVSNVTVVASAMPSPGSGAVVYPNLQQANATYGVWNFCYATSCSGSAGSGTGSLTLNATVDDSALPASLSGSTLQEGANGASTNTLGYRHLGCPTAGCTGVTHFIDDFWFYIPSTDTAIRALEFDPDDFTGTQGYLISTQCNGPSGTWHFWNSSSGDWDPAGDGVSPYTCGVLGQASTWHHYQLYGTMNFSSGEYWYQTLVLDGSTVFQNLNKQYSQGTPPGPGATLNVQQQIDNDAAASNNVVYYDNYKLTVW